MPIVHQQILNAICDYIAAGGVISENELAAALDFSRELLLFLEIML
jgi:hypothetical protein